ncbi:hypothetical protein BD289DRAFT_202475 [Coniella lustricola]|uniref:Uncharacterized protein n=1 Tax=Coniella lustricola TaxID=2025994 RepID=A0A2T2ZSI2_9PEZI|nr:hypothetical protein BD289DRAFT_202475 [Coniella lustricola]
MCSRVTGALAIQANGPRPEHDRPKSAQVALVPQLRLVDLVKSFAPLHQAASTRGLRECPQRQHVYCNLILMIFSSHAVHQNEVCRLLMQRAADAASWEQTSRQVPRPSSTDTGPRHATTDNNGAHQSCQVGCGADTGRVSRIHFDMSPIRCIASVWIGCFGCSGVWSGGLRLFRSKHYRVPLFSRTFVRPTALTTGRLKTLRCTWLVVSVVVVSSECDKQALQGTTTGSSGLQDETPGRLRQHVAIFPSSVPHPQPMCPDVGRWQGGKGANGNKASGSWMLNPSVSLCFTPETNRDL